MLKCLTWKFFKSLLRVLLFNLTIDLVCIWYDGRCWSIVFISSILSHAADLEFSFFGFGLKVIKSLFLSNLLLNLFIFDMYQYTIAHNQWAAYTKNLSIQTDFLSRGSGIAVLGIFKVYQRLKSYCRNYCSSMGIGRRQVAKKNISMF